MIIDCKFVLITIDTLVSTATDIKHRQEMAVVSEILRFILPRSSAKVSAFQALRKQVREKGLVKTQHFGYVLPNEGFPRPKREDQMCWYIGTPALKLLILYFYADNF